MESIDRLNRAIGYIEENLQGSVSYDEISKITLSPISAFQRFFCLTTGMALSEYIRRRRLSCAASDVLHENEKIIDIAVKYGYDSADAFSVAFKREYRVSPSFARKNKVNVEPFHRLHYTLSIQYIKGDARMKRITNNRPLFDGYQGHNYGLPDCIKFILECKDWPERPDFWDIAALTGDSIAQVYNRNPTTSCEYCVSGYLAGPEHIKYVFDALGHEHEHVTAAQLNADNARYIQKIVDMIDRDIPVLVKTNLNDIPEWHSDVGTYCLIVGYDHGGQIVKLLFGGTETVDCILTGNNKMDLIFIGEKRREITLEELHHNAVEKASHWLTLPERNGMCFGAAAFRAWADDIEAGRFEDGSLPLWENYGVYVCNLATNSGQLAGLGGEKVRELLPTETPIGGKCLLWVQLEELGGGMDMEQVKATMRDKKKRAKIAAALRDYAQHVERVVEVLGG
ncbi:MAG: AraC family transcriptional regulator [Oscillospiraceae bacterium]|nr:AraC family transcriptional regulator [Oscillospiraceae bacterium]